LPGILPLLPRDGESDYRHDDYEPAGGGKGRESSRILTPLDPMHRVPGVASRPWDRVDPGLLRLRFKLPSGQALPDARRPTWVTSDFPFEPLRLHPSCFFVSSRRRGGTLIGRFCENWRVKSWST